MTQAQLKEIRIISAIMRVSGRQEEAQKRFDSFLATLRPKQQEDAKDALYECNQFGQLG